VDENSIVNGDTIGQEDTTDEHHGGKEDIVGAVLVVGGGIAGMQSSLDLANADFKVYLLDTSPAIGGTMAQLDKTFPTNDCSMCIMSPKLVDVARHHNIELLTYSDLEKVEGEAGNFQVTVKKKARYVDLDKCTGCGLCAKECPIEAISQFNEGLSSRKSIYVKYPQAVPLVFTIDRDMCIGCGLCENLCLADAIQYDSVETTEILNVGSIIVCPGFEEFDPTRKSEYGYGRFPNVVTSIEFERILSASGPFKGHVQRPSDGDIPTKVGWIQCVGSRDNDVGNNFCSSVCCTYSIKEAVIAKEHVNTIEPTIFFMDMRTYGKGFEQYYQRAKTDYGVRFVRCRVSEIQEDPETNNLLIRYETEQGELIVEEFELVVLSVGFEPKGDMDNLARRLGIDLNKFGFCETKSLAPMDTSREGVFVCGAFSGPKDIPETVIEASGAAAKAGGLIASQRAQMIDHQELPDEIDVSGQEPRIGVFVCHCGINIGGYLDVPTVMEYAKTLPYVVYAEHNLYTCSQDTQMNIVEVIKEQGLNRVIVASCTPRTHEPLFQETIREAGLNPHLFEMANIRDQCSWVHMNLREAATDKARDLVRIAVAKAYLREPLPVIALPVVQKALVIGGGLAGMVSALSIADQGYPVYLIEKETELGGNLRRIHFLLGKENAQEYLTHILEKVRDHKNITTMKGTTIESIQGNIGNFTTMVRSDSSALEGNLPQTTEKTGITEVTESSTLTEMTTLEHGVVIVATGAEEYQPNEYLYGEDDRVVTQLELEERFASANGNGSGGGKETDDGIHGKTVGMIQCVGSRNDEHPYCSRVCCADAVKNAIKLKEMDPENQVFILYRDMRTYGFNETYYEQARELGVQFIRYDLERKPEVAKSKVKGTGVGKEGTGRKEENEGSMEITVRDLLLGEDLMILTDLLVLSSGIVAPPENEELGKQLKVPLNQDGFFLEAHVKLRPVDFSTEGVFLAGLAHSPKAVSETISQASAAAARACTVLAKDTLESEPLISEVNQLLCAGCGLCVEACPYSAIELVECKADVNSALCKGCGLCSATCRSGAIQQKGFKDQQLLSMIKGCLSELF